MKAFSRNIVFSLILILTILSFSVSRYATPAWVTIIENYYAVTLTNATGSLWSREFEIEKITYQNKHSQITLNQVQLSGIEWLPANIKHIKAKNITLSANNTTDELGIDISKLLTKVELDNITLNNGEAPNVAFEIDKKKVTAQLLTLEDNSHQRLLISLPNTSLDLAVHQTDEMINLTSLNSSEIKNIAISYFKQNQQLSVKVDHVAKSQIQLTLFADLAKEQYIGNIDNIVIPVSSENFNLKGTIDTTRGYYLIHSDFKDSYIKVQNADDDTIILSASISNLSRITPYMEGGCYIHASYQNQNLTLYAHADYLSLPLLKIKDLQLTYDPNSKSFIYVSAEQLRNPLISLEQPSLKVNKESDRFDVLALALHDNKPQSILLNFKNTSRGIETHIPRMSLNNNQNTTWQLAQSEHILLSSEGIDIPKITVSSNTKQKLSISGNYQFLDSTWNIQTSAENIQTSFNSQGIIDYDTEVVLNDGVLNGNISLSKTADSTPNITGSWRLDDFNATILNIVPNFPFPLDYHAQESSLIWDHGDLSGSLKSENGEINIYTHNDEIFIESDEIIFQNKKNKISGAVNLAITESSVHGEVDVTEVKLGFDPAASFTVFPKDIEVIGDIPTPKPPSSPIDVNFTIHAHDIPFSILGFQGNATGDLDVAIPAYDSESITGHINIQNPELVMLNHLVPLSHLSISYNQQQWLDGHINLAIEKSSTIHASNSEVITAKINLTVTGKLQAPSFDIHTNPIHLSKVESLNQIISSSTKLPKGNENPRLMEIISGMKRDEGLLVLLQTVNDFLLRGFTLRPKIDSTKSFTSNLQESELMISKQIGENIWLSFQQQLNQENSLATFDYIINSWLSTSLQYSRDDFISLNLLFNN